MNDIVIALLIMCPIVVAVGSAIAVSPPTTVEQSHPTGIAERIRFRLVGVAVVITLVIAGLTGWILPSMVIGAGLVIVVRSNRRVRPAGRTDIERLDALAVWLENLRDVLIAGEQPLGAVIATAPRSPLPIRAEVRRLARGLTRYEPAVMLGRFADELDDPVADLVATGLHVAIERGGRTAAVLDKLAEQTRHSTERRRIIEAERAPIIREVAVVSWIMAVLMVGIVIAGRSGYLAVYATPVGQIVLSGALAAYGLLIIRVRRLARFEQPGRLMMRGRV